MGVFFRNLFISLFFPKKGELIFGWVGSLFDKKLAFSFFNTTPNHIRHTRWLGFFSGRLYPVGVKPGLPGWKSIA